MHNVKRHDKNTIQNNKFLITMKPNSPIVNNKANQEVDASTSVSYLRLRMFIANSPYLMLIYVYKGRDPLREEPYIKRRKTGKVFFKKKYRLTFNNLSIRKWKESLRRKKFTDEPQRQRSEFVTRLTFMRTSQGLNSQKIITDMKMRKVSIFSPQNWKNFKALLVN